MTAFHIPGYRKSLSPSKARRLLAEAQNWRCCWCGEVMEYRRRDEPIRPMTVTIEHVTPRSQGGGKYDWFNVAAAHRICNSSREQ